MKEKVKTFQSLKARLAILVILAVLITAFFMTWIYAPNYEKEVVSLSQNYLSDLSLSYGRVLENEIKNLGAEKALSLDNLQDNLAGVSLEGMDSSYVYVVSPDGTMLYHPTPEKIGQPVENEVVKGVTKDLQAGKKVENKLVTYVFKGENKYAVYYVNQEQDFILIVTVGEDEVLAPVNKLKKWSMIDIVIIFIVFSLIDLKFIGAVVTKPIIKLQQKTAKLAAMDFTTDEEYKKLDERKDEIGLISRALEGLRGELVTVVGTIREDSGVLSEAADMLRNNAQDTNMTMEQVESAINDIAQGATSQAEETQQATEQVIKMGNMIQDTSQKVEELMQSAEQMDAANRNAKEILEKLNEINKQSEEYIDVIAKQTDVTNESALKIGEATKIITEIAEETNLLSLNASIEAARAGEQGRGFAVVASEIQKLAEQSTESAKQIENIIHMLLSDSEKAVETMGQVKGIMSTQSDCMVHTDEAFLQIQRGVEQSVSGMNVIAGKTQELDAARTNVVDIVNNLTAIAEQNAAATQETSASVVEVASIVTGISEKAEELNTIAEQMEEKVSVFQI